MINIEIVQIALLIITTIFAWIDIKVKAIPSIFLTAVIFLMLALFPQNLIYGLLALLISIILYEGDFIKGLADIKVITFLGLSISTMFNFFTFIGILLFSGIIAKVLVDLKSKGNKEGFAFVPVILIAYIIYILINSLF
jgi:hypothetical protein